MSIIESTYKEFLENYESNLEYHKAEYEDNCELTFISEKQYFYSAIIDTYESSMLYDSSHLSQEKKEGIKELKKTIEELIVYDNQKKDIILPDIILWERLQVSSYKIMEFLKQRKQELEKDLNPTSQQPEPELDLSDTSAVEKIIYLNELGIIDFLRTKTKAGISNGGLASVLSGITGIKAETIKPSLNRLSNNDTIDNKHPYYTTKTVEKIKTFLIKLGF